MFNFGFRERILLLCATDSYAFDSDFKRFFSCYTEKLMIHGRYKWNNIDNYPCMMYMHML